MKVHVEVTVDCRCRGVHIRVLDLAAICSAPVRYARTCKPSCLFPDTVALRHPGQLRANPVGISWH